MSIFKQATQLKLRFNTPRGVLSTEQLWDLSLTELDTLAVELETVTGKKKSFLDIKSEEDEISQIRFDIVLDILTTKVKEREEINNAKNIKEHNEKILSLIASKKDESLKDMTIEELSEMIK